jgi:hypothetical protein
MCLEEDHILSQIVENSIIIIIILKRETRRETRRETTRRESEIQISVKQKRAEKRNFQVPI